MFDDSDEIFQQLVASVQGHEDLLSSSSAIMGTNNNGNGDNTAPSQSNTAVPGDNSAVPANSNPNSATEPRRVPLVTVTFVNHPAGTVVTGPSAATLARGHALPTVSPSVPSLAKFCTVTPHVAFTPAPPARRVALVNKPAISHVVRKTLRKYADVYAEKPNRPVVVANNASVINSGQINHTHGSLPAVPQTHHAVLTAAPFNGVQAINVSVNVQHQAPVPAVQPQQNRISYYAYNYHNKVKPRDKLSPSHIPVSRLQIGAWSRQSQFVGDTMCKFLYNKKELVWEMLHSGGLKYKILIHFADVTGFDFDIPNSVFAKHKAKQAQGKDGDEGPAGNVSRLIVELSKAPEFFVEINPQPGKNTQWTRTTDFTDGEASACRYHVLEFNRGHLPHHYQKLLSSDARLKLIVETREVTVDAADLSFRPAPALTDVNVSSVFALPSAPVHARPPPPVHYVNTASSALHIALPLHVVPASSVLH